MQASAQLIKSGKGLDSNYIKQSLSKWAVNPPPEIIASALKKSEQYIRAHPDQRGREEAIRQGFLAEESLKLVWQNGKDCGMSKVCDLLLEGRIPIESKSSSIPSILDYDRMPNYAVNLAQNAFEKVMLYNSIVIFSLVTKDLKTVIPAGWFYGGMAEVYMKFGRKGDHQFGLSHLMKLTHDCWSCRVKNLKPLEVLMAEDSGGINNQIMNLYGVSTG